MIEMLGLSKLGLEVIDERFRRTDDADPLLLRALLLSLGSYPREIARRFFVDRTLELFRKHPHSGVHFAAEWLLYHWGLDRERDQAVQELAGKGRPRRARTGSSRRAASRWWSSRSILPGRGRRTLAVAPRACEERDASKVRSEEERTRSSQVSTPPRSNGTKTLEYLRVAVSTRRDPLTRRTVFFLPLRINGSCRGTEILRLSLLQDGKASNLQACAAISHCRASIRNFRAPPGYRVVEFYEPASSIYERPWDGRWRYFEQSGYRVPTIDEYRAVLEQSDFEVYRQLAGTWAFPAFVQHSRPFSRRSKFSARVTKPDRIGFGDVLGALQERCHEGDGSAHESGVDQRRRGAVRRPPTRTVSWFHWLELLSKPGGVTFVREGRPVS